ncbi:MAG: ATP adenylyltransferase [Pleurocapsa sp.]
MVNQANYLSETSLIKTDNLWQQVVQKTAFARQTGALKSIETEYKLLEQAGIPFVVRTLSNVVTKENKFKQQKAQEAKTGKIIDPFLPYEEDLFICDISASHFCLLNKYNVVEHHLLIVTRAFEEQTELLNICDFEALWACMQEIDGLAFYNGGEEAGASQRHKHLQLIPLPFIPHAVDLPPIEAAIANIDFNGSITKIPAFPFRHAIAPLDLTGVKDTVAGAKIMFDCYRNLLTAVGWNIKSDCQQQPGAYNFLATKNWMLIVPRSHGKFETISVNSLGFAGSLFVRDRNSWERLKEVTPMTVLSQVAHNF